MKSHGKKTKSCKNPVGNNLRVFGYSASNGSWVSSVKITQIRKPGMLLALTGSGESEAMGKRSNTGYCVGPGGKSGPHPESVWTDRIALDESIKQRHRGGCSILFMDSQPQNSRWEESTGRVPMDARASIGPGRAVPADVCMTNLRKCRQVRMPN